MKKVSGQRAGGAISSGILYEGPSLLDGQKIIVVATYSDRNAKTGTMLQTYILRADIDPREASKTGADVSICGACPHRGAATDDPARKLAKGRTCYVNIGQGPLIVWKAYGRGHYKPVSAADIGRGRMVRLGTYGDPAAVPDQVWDDLLSQAQGWTGYSHASGHRPDIVMQSADNISEAQAHWSAGRRTFRILQDLAEFMPDREVLCPASKEAGRRTTCDACKLCSGLASKSPKSVAIVLH